jgi:hypothetical protein
MKTYFFTIILIAGIYLLNSCGWFSNRLPSGLALTFDSTCKLSASADTISKQDTLWFETNIDNQLIAQNNKNSEKPELLLESYFKIKKIVGTEAIIANDSVTFVSKQGTIGSTPNYAYLGFIFEKPFFKNTFGVVVKDTGTYLAEFPKPSVTAYRYKNNEKKQIQGWFYINFDYDSTKLNILSNRGLNPENYIDFKSGNFKTIYYTYPFVVE